MPGIEDWLEEFAKSTKSGPDMWFAVEYMCRSSDDEWFDCVAVGSSNDPKEAGSDERFDAEGSRGRASTESRLVQPGAKSTRCSKFENSWASTIPLKVVATLRKCLAYGFFVAQ